MILTNRPLVSNVHYLGHICLSYFQDITTNNNISLVPEIKLDGVIVACTLGTCNNLTTVHIPSSVFSTGNVLTFKLKNYLGEDASSLYTFNIIKKGCDVVNVAWLNTKGGIDHYTFYSNKKVKISAESTFIDNGSYKTIASKRFSDYQLISEYENKATRDWLSEIIGSPAIWILPFTSVQLINSSLNTLSLDLEQIEITLRPYPTKLQSL